MWDKIDSAIDEYDRRTRNVLLLLIMSPFIVVTLWVIYVVSNNN